MAGKNYSQVSLDALYVPGVCLGYRVISVGDEYGLLLEEEDAFANCVVKVRRASGAARIIARELLLRLKCTERVLPKSRAGAPIWPDGIVGSMAHTSSIAVAAVGRCRDVLALGVDVEPAEPLPSDLLEIIATPRERRRIAEDPYGGRLLFVAKEAVYKAVYPLDQELLDHQDVEIDFAGRKGLVRNGRAVNLQFSLSTQLIALAYIATTT